MQFRIADTFTDSLDKLDAQEKKAAKTTAFDLQIDPAHPGHRFHRIERARDDHFWSVRVNRDIRLIVHKTASSLLLCYVDHHDKAYRWAERRRLETHPKTGAAQFVEVREAFRDVEIPRYVEREQPAGHKPALFPDASDDELLGYGVPTEWLQDVRAADEDSLLEIADHLPGEAAEALLALATGSEPVPVTATADAVDPFAHPDAQRRFRTMESTEELAQALDYPWEKWTVFLHPAQRAFVERDFDGAARVSGSAGTGKTVVAIHRAVHLARKHVTARILLTTFNEVLANTLRVKLRRLAASEPQLAERIEIAAIDSIAERLFSNQVGKANVATRAELEACLDRAVSTTGETGFSRRFLWHEWSDVVDAWQLYDWDDYRDVIRLGRRTRLPIAQRERLWALFRAMRAELERQELLTIADLYQRVTNEIGQRRYPPFDSVVIDEAQDITVPQLRFLAALGAGRPNALFFAGDLGQRIFQTPFSWKSLGVDVRGRSKTLKINYRTSHQIRSQADRLLDPEVSDLDGNTDDRRGTVSVFNGANPSVKVFETTEAEAAWVAEWLIQQPRAGGDIDEIGVIVRSNEELPRAEEAARRARLEYRILSVDSADSDGKLALATMHVAKGTEFRAVAVIACDDEIIPRQARIESIGDEADLEEVHETERHLLYVACTRARDALLVSGIDPGSEFLHDLADHRG